MSFHMRNVISYEKEKCHFIQYAYPRDTLIASGNFIVDLPMLDGFF